MSHPASSLAFSLASSSASPGSGTVLALGPQWLDPSYLISALGPFVLETKGEYAATVTVKVKDIDYDSFLAKTSANKLPEFQ